MNFLIRRYALFFIVFLGTHALYAQEQKNPQLRTPRQTITTHLLFLQPEYQEGEQAEKYLGYSARALRNPSLERSMRKELPTLAVQLKEVMDGLGQYIALEDLPDDPNYQDTTRQNPNEYLLFSHEGTEVYLEKVGRNWYYSVETVEALASLHASVFIVDLERMLNELGVPGAYHQASKIGIFLLGTVLTYLLFTLIFYRFLKQLAKRFGYLEEAEKLLGPVARPISIFVTLLLMKALLPTLGIPPQISSGIILVFKFVIPLFGVLVAYRLVGVLGHVFGRVTKRTANTLDDQLVPLLVKTFKVVVVIVGALSILQSLGVDTDRFWTGISIGGLAFALAAQDTIKNFFGSVMIFVDRPFQIGDWIVTVDDVNGTVEEIGFRSTRIRTFEDAVTSIPNGKLADATVRNMGLRRQRRFLTTIGITYDTPPHLIEAYVKGLRRIANEHPSILPNTHRIHFNSMGDFSLNILIYAYLHVKDYDHELIAKEELYFHFVELAEHLGIRFAFPTQTLHVEEVPGQQALTPIYTETEQEFNNKLDSFFANANIRHRSKEELGQLDHDLNHPGAGA